MDEVFVKPVKETEETVVVTPEGGEVSVVPAVTEAQADEVENVIEAEAETAEDFSDMAEDVSAEETVDVSEAETVETENPVSEDLPAHDTITAEEIQDEPAEPLADDEAVVEEPEPITTDEVHTPVSEEAVIPSYIAHAMEEGTRETPVIAGGGREVLKPSILE